MAERFSDIEKPLVTNQPSSSLSRATVELWTSPVGCKLRRAGA